MSKQQMKGKTQFLPKGLTYRKVDREPKWVRLEVPGMDETAPPFEVLLKFMSAKRHTAIFQPVAYARSDDDKAHALAKAQRTFCEELIADWRGFTIPVHNLIVRADHQLQCMDPDDPEAVEAWNRYFDEGMEFDLDFAVSVYANSEADKFQNMLVAALTAFHDHAQKIEAEGNAASPTSAAP